jgi:hypothetical protein
MNGSSKRGMRFGILFKLMFSRRARNAMKQTARIKGMIKIINATGDSEIACEEAYRLLGEYADMLLRGEDPGALLPQVKHHLEMCMDCREELEMLLSALRSTTG